MLVGKSVHNQRIERLWRDVYGGVIKFYHDLFLYMEAIGVLDPDDETHLFCLHFVYIPRINNHLEQWTGAWINHSICTADNLSPLQLWMEGILQANEDVDELYGIDYEGPLPEVEEDGDVSVPTISTSITEDEFEDLCLMIDPMATSHNYGIDIYLEVLHYVSQ
eukprot:Em0002g1250a